MEVIHENQTSWMPISNEPVVNYRDNMNDMGEVLQKRQLPNINKQWLKVGITDTKTVEWCKMSKILTLSKVKH